VNVDAIQPALGSDASGAGHTSDALLRIKVVPGSSRNKIAGMLGDRLKVAVAAPPEGGKANKAVIRLLAKAAGVSPATVTVDAGHTQPLKTLRFAGMGDDELATRLCSNA